MIIFTAITAGELSPNLKFAFEDRHGATVFCALEINRYAPDLPVEINLSHGTTINMPSSNALYLVTVPEAIRVTELRVGDRYSMYAESTEIYTVVSVEDGSIIVPTTPPNEWVWIGIGDNRYHTFGTNEYVATVYRHSGN